MMVSYIMILLASLLNIVVSFRWPNRS
jgi:hypothetical protein